MNKGDFIEIEYVGRVKDTNEIFDLTDEKLAKQENLYNPKFKYGPMVVVVGTRQVLPGIDEKLESMKPNQEDSFDVPAEKAFGKRNPKAIKLFPINEFKKQGAIPSVGQMLTFQNGSQGKVVSVSSGRVKVDFNHPLAGRALTYELKTGKIVDKPEDKIEALITFFMGSKEKFSVTVEGEKAKVTAPEGKSLPDQLKNILSKSISQHVKEVKDIEFVDSKKEAEAEQQNVSPEGN